MTLPFRRGSTHRVGALLVALALVPLLGLTWLASMQIKSATDARSDLGELGVVAERLSLLVELEQSLMEENAFTQAATRVELLGVPPSVMAEFGGGDLAGQGLATRDRVDALLVEADRADLVQPIRAARDASDSGSPDVASLYQVAADELRASVTRAAVDVVRVASNLDDAERLVTAAQVLEHGAVMPSALAQQVGAFFALSLEIQVSAEQPEIALITSYDEYLSERAQLELLLRPGSAAQSQWDEMQRSGTTDELVLMFDEMVEEVARGEFDAVDLAEAGPADLVSLLSAYTLGLEGNAEHFALVDAARLDLDGEMQAAWDESRATYLAVLGATALVALVSCVGVVVITRSIVQPLQDLSNSAEALQSGADLEAIAVRGPVEVRKATRALNEAMGHIRHAEDQALALADGRLDDAALDNPAPGRLGESLRVAVDRLRESLSEREKYRRRLAHEATHDGLTSLPNRSASMAHLDKALARMERSDGTAAVLFIDLDGFKQVNDVHGHPVGDMVLQKIARRLVNTCRQGDLVGRIGGDEFLVVAEPVSGASETVVLAERLRAAIAEPIEASTGTFLPNASIGIAIADGVLTGEELIRDADLAVYQAKENGKGRIELCNDELRNRLVEEADLEQAIRRAIADDEFELHYQSTIDAMSGSPNSLEALIRWERPGTGMMQPDSFIPFAERSDLIIELDCWVINAGIRQMAAWAEHPILGGMTLAVNVSGRHLLNGDLYHEVSTALERWQVDPTKLTVEVTESALLDDLAAAAQPLEALRRLGVRIAIDDFGTGYTSLAHLRTLPVDILKIDRSFIANLENADDLSLVKLIVDTGHLLGAAITAEGVETDDQASILTTLGSDTLQGYRFSRPLSAPKVEEHLAPAVPGVTS